MAYAENFHGGFHSVAYGGHLYVVCAVCDVTFYVIFMFPNNDLAKFVDIICIFFLHPLSLFYVSLHWI